MFRKLLGSVREYKAPSILTVIFMTLEALIEAVIPFITTKLLSGVREGAPISDVLKIGGLLVIMALLSLACGGSAAFTGARLRQALLKICVTIYFIRYSRFHLVT